jgi:hypothetical protein
MWIEPVFWMITNLFGLFIVMFLISLPIALIVGKLHEMRGDGQKHKDKVEDWEKGKIPDWR